MLIYSGVLYLTAGGEKTKIEKAKSLITTSVIGIIIIVAAYAIANFVIDAIGGAVSK